MNSVKHIIYSLLPFNLKLRSFKKNGFYRNCGYGKKFCSYVDDAFKTFLSEAERSDERLMRTLTDDICTCWIKYKALPYEYFLYDFRNRDASGRSEFLTDVDRLNLLAEVSDGEGFIKDINDKYSFYCKAKDYFKREALLLNSKEDKTAFQEFARRKGRVFIKPVASSKGFGAHLFEYTDDTAAAGFFEELMENDNAWIVEECIIQCQEMMQWNPTSVNTIRIPTFLCNGQFAVKWTRMRCGKKGSIVDNAGAGGIIVNVDPLTGVISSDGIDESYAHFEKHPDYGLTFKGWQVPRWNELLEIVERLHKDVFPKQVYLAWDFALTDDGWVLVEGNWGQMLGYQTASQTGVKKEFYKLIGANG